MNASGPPYMFHCFREKGIDQKPGLGGTEKRTRHILRFEKRRSGGGSRSGVFPCFTGGGIDANGPSGQAGDSEGFSMVPRQSQVYDPTLAKKILGRTERTLYERLKDSEEMPLQHLHNEDINEEALTSPKGALDQYLFRNVPDATMRLGQERHKREVCSSKLQGSWITKCEAIMSRRASDSENSDSRTSLSEIERELQEFSEAFGSKLLELKKSMGEFAQSMKELMNYDDGNYIEDRLWEEADNNSKAVDMVTSRQIPPRR